MIMIKYCPIMGAQVQFAQMPKQSKAQKRVLEQLANERNEQRSKNNARNRRRLRLKG